MSAMVRRGATLQYRSLRTYFPNLTGIEGGDTAPLSFSLIFNNRKDITWPTRGWSMVASIAHIDKSLGSDFPFTRYTFEASYLLPLLTRREVFGLRVGGTYIDGDIADIPCYELAHLGGDRTLRGYFWSYLLAAKGQKKHRRLLSYAINYAAVKEQERGILYALYATKILRTVSQPAAKKKTRVITSSVKTIGPFR